MNKFVDISGLSVVLANGWISGAAGVVATHPMDTMRGIYFIML